MSSNDKSGRRLLRVTAPYDSETLAELTVASERETEEALDKSFRLFRTRDAWLSLAERIGIFERASRVMLRERITLASTIALESGKPLIDAEIEVENAIDAFKYCVESLRNSTSSTIPLSGSIAAENRIAFGHYEPVGVALAMTAFNHPVNLVVHQIAPAIAAGCPVVVQPSREAPLSCLSVVRILREAGMPADWCQTLILDEADSRERLISDNRIAHLSFTGPAEEAARLRSGLALGTRSAIAYATRAPVLLLEDADIEQATRHVVDNGLYHAGQVCISAQRVFALRPLAQSFADSAARYASGLRLGNPRLADTQVGPLIRPEDVTRVDNWVKRAIEGGARLFCGGTPAGASLYAPTVLLDETPRVEMSRAEISGPVICIHAFDTLDDAIAGINELCRASQVTVFTRDIDRALKVYRRLDASTIMVNSDPSFRLAGTPTAGIGHSDSVIGSIPQMIDRMRREKSLVLYSRDGE